MTKLITEPIKERSDSGIAVSLHWESFATSEHLVLRLIDHNTGEARHGIVREGDAAYAFAHPYPYLATAVDPFAPVPETAEIFEHPTYVEGDYAEVDVR